MTKIHFVAALVAALSWMSHAQAESYRCPAPSSVTCVPVQKFIGPWIDNGGMMTGNAFAPESSCAGIINLPGGMKRLVCCYTKCGVFYQDVQATYCLKQAGVRFACH